MSTSAEIRLEISTALNGVRSSLAPGVLLRIHPDRVQDLSVADNAGDILILFPSERVTDNDRTFGGNHQSKIQRILIVISLPNYYQQSGAGEVAERVESALKNLKVLGSLFPLTFESRREFVQQKRWVLELSIEATKRLYISEFTEVLPAINEIKINT